MARNVGDLRLLFSVLTGEALGEALPPPHKPSLKGKRLAIWSEERGFPLSSRCRAAVETVADAAASLGARTTVEAPEIDGPALVDLYLQLLLPILATDMPTSLVRAMEVGRPIARMMARSEPFSRSKWALYSAATHHDWLRADEARQRLKRNVASFFGKWHAIVAPVAPSTAFEHVETGDAVTRLLTVDGEPVPYQAFHSWIALATVCHLPAAVIPVPNAGGELPCGVQIIGPEGADLDVLSIAEAIETELGGFRRPPEENLAKPPASTPKAGKRPLSKRAPAKKMKSKPAKPDKAKKPQRARR